MGKGTKSSLVAEAQAMKNTLPRLSRAKNFSQTKNKDPDTTQYQLD